MQKVLTFYDTTIGKKAVMAFSGLILFGFVLGHMAGNLQVFLGPQALNAYAHKLKVDFFPVLIAARVTLIVAVVAHVTSSFQLWSLSAGTRAKPYKVKRNLVTSYAAQTMMLTGPILAGFIVFHLAHFTWPGLSLAAHYKHTEDVYANVVQAFRIPWATGVYVVAQLCLGYHLFHGSWSLMQTLGLSHPQYNGSARLGAQLFAVLVTVGNVFIPVAVMLGLAPLAPR